MFRYEIDGPFSQHKLTVTYQNRGVNFHSPRFEDDRFRGRLTLLGPCKGKYLEPRGGLGRGLDVLEFEVLVPLCRHFFAIKVHQGVGAYGRPATARLDMTSVTLCLRTWLTSSRVSPLNPWVVSRRIRSYTMPCVAPGTCMSGQI